MVSGGITLTLKNWSNICKSTICEHKQTNKTYDIPTENVEFLQLETSDSMFAGSLQLAECSPYPQQ